MHLLGVAYHVGYQNSGITPSRSRNMLAIRSTHKIDTPIAYVEQGKIHCLVDPAYLFLLLTMSNQKFEQNMDRMKVFEDTMIFELSKSEQKKNWEPKEVRRERKRLEGLERKRLEGLAAREKKESVRKEVADKIEDLLENDYIESCLF
jgi:tRNA wybutosine-synthesizing protein 3